MKKLEDIPKNEVFKVPEGYFDALPGIVQARVATQDRKVSLLPVFRYSIRYALPAIVIFSLGIFWFTRQAETKSAEAILASIETQDLVAYLSTADFTTDELLDQVSLDAQDADQITEEVYGLDLDADDDVDELLNQFDLNSL